MFSRDLGPAAIYADNELLAPNKDIHFTVENQRVRQADNQFGTSAKDYIYTGSLVQMTVNLSEVSLATLDKIMPGSSLDTGGQLMLSNPTGEKARDSAVQLEARLYVDGVESTDALDFITIFVAVADSKMDLGFDGDGERIVQVVFEGLPVTSVPTGESYAINDKCAFAYGEVSE